MKAALFVFLCWGECCPAAYLFVRHTDLTRLAICQAGMHLHDCFFPLDVHSLELFCIVHVYDMDACSHFNGHPAAGSLITEPLVQIQAFPCTSMLLLPTKETSRLKFFSCNLPFLVNTLMSPHTQTFFFSFFYLIWQYSCHFYHLKAFPSMTTLKSTDLAECVVLQSRLWPVKPDTHGTQPPNYFLSQCFWNCLPCIFHQWFGY